MVGWGVLDMFDKGFSGEMYERLFWVNDIIGGMLFEDIWGVFDVVGKGIIEE